ncbi:MAG: hypothetical protein WAM03_07150 [Pseudolabrys sp.]|jgi:hypothetical protein
MRLVGKVMATLMLATALLQTPGDSGLGATNCGFLTIEQCRATLSGGASFCVPNQFYNPGGPAKRTRNRQDGREVRAYAMPYDPYPWCAFISDPGN